MMTFATYSGFQSSLLFPFSTVMSQSQGFRVFLPQRCPKQAPRTTIKTHKAKMKGKQICSVDVDISADTLNQAVEFLGEDDVKLLYDLANPQMLQNMALGKAVCATKYFNAPLYNKVLCSIRHGFKNPWYESHVSGNSFLENKHMADCSYHNGFGRLYSSKSLFNGSPLFTLQPVQSIQGTQIRGFKTKISKTGSIDNAATESNVLKALFKGEKSEFGKKNLKIAFAEGYISGSDKSQKTFLEKLLIWVSPKKSVLKAETFEIGEYNVKLAFAEGFASGKNNPDKSILQRIFMAGVLGCIIALGYILVSIALIFKGNQSEDLIRQKSIDIIGQSSKVTFDDVIGIDEAKQECEDIVKYLKNSDQFTQLGAELPKGLLLVGPPGTGKTLLARALAGEAKVPFFFVSGSEFDQMFVGVGAFKVRSLFAKAKKQAPCIIFIDEIDTVGGKRPSSALHPHANQTINQLLSEMDGFLKNNGIIVIGATNNQENLDKALLRPGRFDSIIQVMVPDLKGRTDLINHYLKTIVTASDIDPDCLARRTVNFTGADIKSVINMAALKTASDNLSSVTMMHLEWARDKVLMGPEKKNRIPDKQTNTITAYHEGGHTVVAYYTKDANPLHKVTIVQRGNALGHTAFMDKELYYMTKRSLMANLDSLMGGRAAEELTFGKEMCTSGASQDLQRATSIATQMVKIYGMSEQIGLRTFDDKEHFSQQSADTIDLEINKLIAESYDRAMKILTSHKKELKDIAETLLKYETLDADEIKSILDGEPMPGKNINEQPKILDPLLRNINQVTNSGYGIYADLESS